MDFRDFFGQTGGGGFSQRQESKPVDTQALYDIIGCAKDADYKALKKAYRKTALKTHPDRGGSEEKFKEVNRAWEILGNQEKRAIYDKHGVEGVERGGGGGETDIMSHLFGGGGRKGKKKGQGGLLSVDVTLENLYNGCTKKGQFNKQFFCDGCGGTGGKNVTQCSGCNGQGLKIQIRQLGPGMLQKVQSKCNDCQGTGEMIAARDRCRTCNGKKVYRKIHTFDVHVMKGMKDKKRILHREIGDQSPGIIPGDVHVEIKMTPHKLFKRNGAHLFYNKEITLVQALTGFEFTMETLDKRTLIVQSEPDVLYAPGSVRAIREEGMPLEDNPSLFGNLYIVISVKFPKHLDPKTVVELGTFLPDIERDEIEMGEDLEEVSLEDVNLSSEKQKWKEEKATRKNYNSQFKEDEDEAQGGQQQTQCQQQ